MPRSIQRLFAGSGGVPRWIRVVNALSLLLFVAGGAVYARAWFGMQGLRSYETAPDAEPFAGMARFNHFHELSQIGIGLVLAAVAVAVLSAIATAVVPRRRNGQGGEPDDPRHHPSSP